MNKIDKFTNKELKVILIVALGMFFDQYEVFLSGTISTIIKSKIQIDSAYDMYTLLGSSFVGMFIGALSLGYIADKIGRKKAFIINITVYSVFSILGAFSPDVYWLIFFRFMSGIGIGGELVLADTYLTEILPEDRKGKGLVIAYTLSFIAVPITALLALFLHKVSIFNFSGWRILFLIGGLGLIVAVITYLYLPESSKWLERSKKTNQNDIIVNDKSTHWSRLLKPDIRKQTIMTTIMGIFNAGYYGFSLIAPIVLKSKGINISDSLSYLFLSYLGYPIGSMLAYPIIERFERKTTISIAATLMAVFAIVYGLSSINYIIVLAGFFFTLTSNIYSNAYHTYNAEVFPESVRGKGASIGYSISRLATAALPFILLSVIQNYSAIAAYAMLAIGMMILVIDVQVLGKKTKIDTKV